MKLFSRAATLLSAASLLLGLGWSGPAQAAHASPQRLGAFAGAMKYCADRYDEKERRYWRARVRVAREVDDMSRRERRRAIEAGDYAYRHGRFMGQRLNRYQCRSLLKMSEWRRFDYR